MVGSLFSKEMGLMAELYFCVFSDYHYWPGHYPIGTEGMAQIMKNAYNHSAKLAIQCGDLAHNAPGSPELMHLFTGNAYGIRVLSCLGNHEVEAIDSLESVLQCYGMKNNYEFHDIDGFRLIMLDTNYYKTRDGLMHNPPRSHSAPNGDGDYLPPEELEWLRDAVMTSPYPCLLFSHASLECPVGCKDALAVRELIREANRVHPGRVLMCINGHYHRNHITVEDDVVFFDVNAVYNGHWQPVKHDGYPKAFADSARMARQVCIHKDPLHAFVRVNSNGKIDIEGMQTGYLFDVSPESLGADTVNAFGRRSTPEISSYHRSAIYTE